MAFSPKSYEKRLTRFIARQDGVVGKIIDDAMAKAVLEVQRFGVTGKKKDDFFFINHTLLNIKVDRILKDMSSQITDTIISGIEWAWDLSNTKNDSLVWSIINSIGNTRVPYSAPGNWMQKNLAALEAFEERRVAGMNLSDRVWKLTSSIKGDLELALDIGLGEGMSADRLSREVRMYLREPNRLYRRVRDEKGVLRLSKSAANYHPGRGVYRSSYKNARRLTATETNMAYRSADFSRYQELDFVLGIQIHLSNNHTCLGPDGKPHPFVDICDDLAGRYPAEFKFTGWHPLCRCYVTTILPSQDEMIAYLASMDENGHSDYQFSGRVEDVPPQFKEWVAGNGDRIARAEERGTLPYFLRDNEWAWKGGSAPQAKVSGVISDRVLTDEEKAVIKERAKARHEARTPAEIRAIQDRWDERVYGKEYVENMHRIEARLGVQRGKRMTHEEADTGRVNPNYGKKGYSTNCSTCSGVYVLRRNGFDVYADRNYGDNTVRWLSQGETTWAKWIDGKTSYSKAYDWMTARGLNEMSPEMWKAFFEEKTKAVGVYEISIPWGPRNGHSTLLERTADGKLRRIEQQWMGASEDIDHLVKQIYKIPNRDTRGIMRVDNARFNTVYIDAVKVNKKKVAKR